MSTNEKSAQGRKLMLPLTVKKSGHGIGCFSIFDNNGSSLGIDFEDDTANAIVEACNNYSALQSQCSQLAEALETTLRLSDQLTDWINRAGPALKDMLDAYERRVRSACTNESELTGEPWKCREWLAASAVLAEKPVAVVDLAALSLLPKETP